jgi:hypothetical protein
MSRPGFVPSEMPARDQADLQKMFEPSSSEESTQSGEKLAKGADLEHETRFRVTAEQKKRRM